MTRRQAEPHEHVRNAMISLKTMARNLLLDNINFKKKTDECGRITGEAYYIAKYPKTEDFIKNFLSRTGECLVEKIDDAITFTEYYANIANCSDDELIKELTKRNYIVEKSSELRKIES